MQNKWSNQILVANTVRKGDEEFTERQLIVCNRGIDLFQKTFVESKRFGEEHFLLPFDIIVLSGNPCPRGKFYEVDYTIGSKYGTINRALIQAVAPTEDLQLIFWFLVNRGILPADVHTHKAFLLDHVDAVRIVSCSHDKEEKDTVISGSHITPDPTASYSVLDMTMGRGENLAPIGVCLEIYNTDHCHELWLGPNDTFESKPIFVCGTKNVWDSAFAEMRKEDLSELEDHLDQAVDILNTYGLSYVLIHQNGDVRQNPDGKASMNVTVAIDADSHFLEMVLDHQKLSKFATPSTGQDTPDPDETDF